MKDYNSFDLIKHLYFVRVSGTAEEMRAAEIIAEKVKGFGIDNVEEQTFEVDYCEIKRASLSFDGGATFVDCVGVGMSGSTTEEGITAPVELICSATDARVKNVEGKICIIPDKRARDKIYKILVQRGAVGLVLGAGTVYQTPDETDIDPYYLREQNYSMKKLPAVCIRMAEMEIILEKCPYKATIVIIQEEKKALSRNVIATIEGEKSDEILAFTAHFDSVRFSRGAYDNASGSACILEMLKRFAAVNAKPKRTLKFIWCGSEESGLLGSKHFVKSSADEMDKYIFDVNVDMVGATIGYDLAVATAEQALVDYLKYLSRIKGFALTVKQDVYSSDSTPFADAGVPAVSFARLSPKGGATIHSRDDVIERLSEANYIKTCDFIFDFANTLVCSEIFPIGREIPDNMKKELDYYLLREERPD